VRVHITGASGAGTTTLATELGRRLSWPAYDTDDYYWLATDPPYTAKRPVDERLRLLQEPLQQPSWILSGSLVSWGDSLLPLFEAVIFLAVPSDERLRRLLARERQRFGASALAPRGWRHDEHRAFMEWAAKYDTAGPELRSLAMHEAWLTRLSCPVLRIEGLHSVAERTTLAEAFLRARGAA